MEFDNFRDNRLLKDYLRIKEEQDEISKNLRKKRKQQQNKEWWARYQQYLRTMLANKMLDFTLGSKVLLLDLFPNAAAAYSVRRLSSTYMGSALRVRKEVSLVDEEMDIGFDVNGNLDTTTILSFASDADGGNVYVSIWYDQSGNGNNAVQSDVTLQPQIVINGDLYISNNRVFMNFAGGTHNFTVENDITGEDFGVYSVIKPDVQDPSTDGWIFDNFTSYGRGLLHDDYYSGGMTLISDTTSTTPIRVRSGIDTNVNLISGIIDNESPAGGEVVIYRNGVEEDRFEGNVPYQENAFPQYIGAGSASGTEGFSGYIGELIIYTSTNLVKSDRPKIDNNIIDYYNI